MSRNIRRVIFWCFLGAFLISAPLVILYTSGYRFDWGSRRIFQTGVIVVESQPRGAEIWINHQPTDQKTPSRLSNLLPGVYSVTLKKTGYLEWSDTVVVRSRQAAILEDVPLLLDTPPQLLSDQTVNNVVAYPERDGFTYLKAEAGVATLHETRPGVGNSRTWPFEFSSDAVLETSSRYNSVVVSTASPSGRRYDVIRLDESSTLLPLTNVSAIRSRIEWLSRDELLFVTDQGLCEFFLPSGTQSCLAFPGVEIWAANDSLYYQVNGEDTSYLYRSTLPWDNQGQIIARLPLAERYGLNPERADLLIATDLASRDVEVIDLSSTDPSITRLPGIGDEAIWDEQQETLLLHNQNEIWLWTIADNDRRLVTRVSDPIGQVRWSPDKQFLLLTQNGKLKALELWTGRHSTFTLAENKVGWFEIFPGTTSAIFISSSENNPSLWQRDWQ